MIQEIEDERRTKQVSRSNLSILMFVVGLTAISAIYFASMEVKVLPGQLSQGDVRSNVNLKGTLPPSVQEATLQAMKEASIEAAKEATIATIKEADITLTTPSSTPEISLTHPKCLSSDGDLEEIVSSSSQIYIIMPQKASGTSMLTFVKRCTTISKEFIGDNPKDNPEFLTHQLNLPRIVATHIKKDWGEELVHDLIQQTTKDSLVVYIYREETDRLISAIRHVVENRLCTPPNNRWSTPTAFIDAATISEDGKKCVVDESRLIQAITEGVNEMGGSVYKSLTCNNYDALEENSPNFVFMDFRKIDQLQTILAKHVCPDLMSKVPIHANESGNRELTGYIRMDTGDENNEVSIAEWAEAKRSLLEWTLKLKKNVSCQGKTRRLENTLSACDDGALQVSSARQMFTQK